MRKVIPDYILGFLTKFNGGVSVYKLNPDTKEYEFIDYISITIDQYFNPVLSEYIDAIFSVVPKDKRVLAVMVKADYRDTDDKRTVFRIGVNTSISSLIAELYNFKIKRIKNSMIWKNYFNLDHENPKESALEKAKELFSDVNIESIEQAEAMLIGLYGIREVVHSDLSKS